MTKVSDVIALELSGVRLEPPPTGSTRWDRPPIVELAEGRLRWRAAEFEGDSIDQEITAGFGLPLLVASPLPTDLGPAILRGFVALADAPDTKALVFARRWGPLHLCRHGLPRTHPQAPATLAGDDHRSSMVCATVADELLEGSESVDHWRFWAKRARATLRLGTLRGGGDRSSPPGALEAILSPGEFLAAAQDPAEAERLLDRELALWLGLGAVGVASTHLRLRVATNNLFSVLALALAVAVAGEGIAFCDGCHRPFAPSKQPSQSQRSFCDTCRASGVPGKLAARDCRRRNLAFPGRIRRPKRPAPQPQPG